MTLEAILSFGFAVMVLAIKPGMGMAMVMSRAVAQGLGSVLIFVAGFCVVSVFFLGVVVFGYNYVDSDLIFISLLVKSLAAVYLIYLGVKGLQKASNPFYIKELKIERALDNFTASVMLTLSNPLTIVFYAGILPTVMNVQDIGVNDFMLLSMAIIAVEYAVGVGYSLPFLLYRKKISEDFMRGMGYFSSIVIILIGLYIGYTALPAKDLASIF